MRRNGLAVRDALLAVFLLQLAARVAMEAVIERLYLRPQALGLGLELGSAHVVAGTPELAEVLVAETLRAFVRELDEALVILAHRRRDRVPASPGLELLVPVAARGERFRYVVDVLAAFRTLRAVLARAVHRGHARFDLGDLRALCRVVRRRRGKAELQELDRTGGFGRHFLALVCLGLRDEPGEYLLVALVGPGRERLGIRGDVSELDPAGLGVFGAAVAQLLVRAGGELIGGFVLVFPGGAIAPACGKHS